MFTGKNCIPIFTILNQLSFGATNWLCKWRNSRRS
nr:MAG TPA: hypothetical protein [Caudoviricetes sp.]